MDKQCLPLFFREFGDVHNRSVEEVWYKRPVLYRNLNPQAFVFSVPFNSGIYFRNYEVDNFYAYIVHEIQVRYKLGRVCSQIYQS